MSEQGSDVGAELNRLRLEYFGLRKRVAELEAALFTLACSEEMLRGVHPTADPRWEILRCAAERARALLAPREPKPCGTCDGSGSVWDGPAGVHISDGNAMKPCPECRGGEETK